MPLSLSPRKTYCLERKFMFLRRELMFLHRKHVFLRRELVFLRRKHKIPFYVRRKSEYTFNKLQKNYKNQEKTGFQGMP